MKAWLLLIVTLIVSGCSTEQASAPAPAAEPAANATVPISSTSPEAVEHMKKGEQLLDNLRPVEAAAEFNEALKLDGNFSLARALLGQATPGAAGLKEIETAASAASGLPPAERALIEGMLAARRGEGGKSLESYRTVTQLAPGDWRGHRLLGQRLMGDEKYAEAVQELKRATELNPEAGGAQNMLGYAALQQGDTAGAVAAFTEYARILPNEPNPQDSLGEALLAAGQFAEAEAAFRRAAERSPAFWNAWDGVAYAKFYAGDAAGARAALAQARELAPRPGDKLAVDQELAAVAEAEGHAAEALRVLAAAEKMTDAPGVAFVPVARATVLNRSGRYREALPLIAAALQRAESGELPVGASRNLRLEALRARVAAEAGLGDSAAAEKTAAAIATQASDNPGDLFTQSSMHYGQGVLAFAKADFTGARAHFEQCSKGDEICRLQIVTAAERAGDAAGAASAREQLLKLYVRDPAHLIVRARLARASRSTN